MWVLDHVRYSQVINTQVLCEALGLSLERSQIQHTRGWGLLSQWWAPFLWMNTPLKFGGLSFLRSIFRFHVSFQGCISLKTKKLKPHPKHHFESVYLWQMANAEGSTKWWLHLYTAPGIVEKKMFLRHENNGHQGVQGGLLWRDLTCCFILFGFARNIQTWTYTFYNRTILGKHSNFFRTLRTSRIWTYPSLRNRHVPGLYKFLVGNPAYTMAMLTPPSRMLARHHQDDEWFFFENRHPCPTKTFICHERLPPGWGSRSKAYTTLRILTHQRWVLWGSKTNMRKTGSNPSIGGCFMILRALKKTTPATDSPTRPLSYRRFAEPQKTHLIDTRPLRIRG